MLSSIKGYQCECDKCGHSWKSFQIPKMCTNSKCRTVKWNGFEPEEVKAPKEVLKEKPIKIPVEDLDWIYLSDSYQDGEVLSWRKKPKGIPQCYKRTSDLSSA